MKRSWFGLALLLLLLGASIAATVYMQQTHAPMAEAAAQAAELALYGDWDGAETRLGEVRRAWESHWPASAAFADHQPMENINGLFAQIEIAAALRDAPDFASLCARLSTELEAMGDAHGFVWWNLL